MSHGHDDGSRWLRYANTILVFDDGAHIDLRTPVTPGDRAVLRARDLDAPFAVITAYNPLGRVTGDEVNEVRHRQLVESLRAGGWRGVIVTGESPDGSHAERSVAVIMPEADAKALADRFCQDAFFWFDGRAFGIRGALRDVDSISLPVAGEAPVS